MKLFQVFLVLLTYISVRNSIVNGRRVKHHHRHHRKHELYYEEDYDNFQNSINMNQSQGSGILRRQKNDKSDLEQERRGFLAEVLLNTMQFASDNLYNLLKHSGNQVKFLLYNLKDPKSGEVFIPDSPNKKSIWNEGASVKILIHGYKDKVRGRFIYGRESMPQIIKNAYLSMKRPENIIAVDWKSLSQEKNYFDSVRNSKLVGELVAEFILNLKKHGYIDSFEKIHIIGFSLGAQTAGVAGHFVQKKADGQKLPRITGLDPAGPGFDGKLSEANRLDKTDAELVDVVHCDKGKASDGHFGTDRTIGTIDFFPNGGSVQPGCKPLPLIVNLITGSCSHNYCPALFQKSILQIGKKFIGCQCKDWPTFEKGECKCDEGPPMGDSCCPTGMEGEYFLNATV